MIRLSTRWYSAKPSLPVIDFGKFLAGSVAQKQESAVKLVNAFKNVGFVYLVNHGIPKKTIDSAFAQSKKFFDLDQSVKNKLAWESPESNRGYVSPGREKVSQLICKDQVQALRDSSPDLKESLEIGKEPSQNFQNMWPVDPKFRAEMMQFYKTCHLFHLDVMDSLALGLGLGGGFFEPYCNGMDHNLRLLHYPDVKKNILDRKDQSRAGSHSDHVGGLQVKNLAGGLMYFNTVFVPAPPIEGAIVVNADGQMVFPNLIQDVIKSTDHRVVSPTSAPSESVYPARFN